MAEAKTDANAADDCCSVEKIESAGQSIDHERGGNHREHAKRIGVAKKAMRPPALGSEKDDGTNQNRE